MRSRTAKIQLRRAGNSVTFSFKHEVKSIPLVSDYKLLKPFNINTIYFIFSNLQLVGRFGK